jgi:hypothetical protein
MTQFFFNTGGDWIAFRRSTSDRYLFNRSGQWVGWFPWGDNDAVDTRGNYLGTIVKNRFVRFTSRPYRGYPGYPGYPGYAGYSGYVAGAEEIEGLNG